MIDRNPNLEIFRYEPRYNSLNASVNMDHDDAESVSSCATDRNNDLELLLTVKAELGALKLKQNRVQRILEEANDGMKTGLEIINNVAKDLRSAKVKNEKINTSIERITKLLSLGL